MRRSAAPSAFNGVKKARFVSPYVNASGTSCNENIDTLNNLNNPSQISPAYSSVPDVSLPRKGNIKNQKVSEPEKYSQFARSTTDILKLLTDPSVGLSCDQSHDHDTHSSSEVSDVISKEECRTLSWLKKEVDEDYNHGRKLCVVNCKIPESSSSNTTQLKGNLSGGSEAKASDKDSNSTDLFYSVLWCKHSMKKHKKWEGDAILIIRNRTAILKDLEGKEIAKGMGYKVKEITCLEVGSIFFIGGKECEIQDEISSQDYMSGKCFQSPSTDTVIGIAP